MSAAIERRLDALERANGSKLAIDRIIWHVVSLDKVDREVRTAMVYGDELHRQADESEEDFIERAYTVARERNPKPDTIPTFGIK